MGGKEETAAVFTARMLGGGNRAKKSLGQNFLIDDQVLWRIAEAAAPQGEEPLLEIGPGLGALTRCLLSAGKKLWAVELDKEKVCLLEREFAGEPLELLAMDALDLDLREIWGEKKGRVVGNLPYYITNPLLMHFLRQSASVTQMTVMVQKEVAQRMAAAPGGKTYGILSVACQLYASVELLFDVLPEAFRPRPKVTSTVVCLKLRPYPGLTVTEEQMLQVVKAAFAQRRKTIANSLSSALKMNKEALGQALVVAGISESARAEQVSLESYHRLAAILQTS